MSGGWILLFVLAAFVLAIGAPEVAQALRGPLVPGDEDRGAVR